MTIPILGEIERLINEHGSSVILKERISLASDQISLIQQQKAVAESQSIALKGEVTNLQEKNLILLRENEALRLDLSQAEEKIRNLEKCISEIHSISLNSVQEKMLLAVSVKSGSEACVLAEYLGLPEDETLQHLNHLYSKRLVHYNSVLVSIPGNPIPNMKVTKPWLVTPLGHNYISHCKLA